MIEGKTKSGFTFELDENVMDNMELVDILAEANEESPFAVSKIAALILGTEQKKRLYDYHRTDDGRVPVKAVYDDIGEMFLAFGQSGKKS